MATWDYYAQSLHTRHSAWEWKQTWRETTATPADRLTHAAIHDVCSHTFVRPRMLLLTGYSFILLTHTHTHCTAQPHCSPAYLQWCIADQKLPETQQKFEYPLPPTQIQLCSQSKEHIHMMQGTGTLCASGRSHWFQYYFGSSNLCREKKEPKSNMRWWQMVK